MLPLIPIIGKLIGGKLATTMLDLALEKGKDVVEKKIEDVTGVKIDLDKSELPKKAEEALRRNQQEIIDSLAIMKEDNRHFEKVNDQMLQERAMINEEVQNARKMAMEFSKSDDPLIRRWIPITIMSILALCFGLLIAIIFLPIEESKLQLATSTQSFGINAILSLLGYITGVAHSKIKQKDDKTNELL